MFKKKGRSSNKQIFNKEYWLYKLDAFMLDSNPKMTIGIRFNRSDMIKLKTIFEHLEYDNLADIVKTVIDFEYQKACNIRDLKVNDQLKNINITTEFFEGLDSINLEKKEK